MSLHIHLVDGEGILVAAGFNGAILRRIFPHLGGDLQLRDQRSFTRVRCICHITTELVNIKGYTRQIGFAGGEGQVGPQLNAVDGDILLQIVEEGAILQQGNFVPYLSQNLLARLVIFIVIRQGDRSIFPVLHLDFLIIILELGLSIVEGGRVRDRQVLYRVVEDLVSILIVFGQVLKDADPVIVILRLCLCAALLRRFLCFFSLALLSAFAFLCLEALIPVVFPVLGNQVIPCQLVQGQIEVGALAAVESVGIVPLLVELDALGTAQLVGDGNLLIVVDVVAIIFRVALLRHGDSQIFKEFFEGRVFDLFKNFGFIETQVRIDYLSSFDIFLSRPQFLNRIIRHTAILVVFGEVEEVKFLDRLIAYNQRLDGISFRAWCLPLNRNRLVGQSDSIIFIIDNILDLLIFSRWHSTGFICVDNQLYHRDDVRILQRIQQAGAAAPVFGDSHVDIAQAAVGGDIEGLRSCCVARVSSIPILTR